MFRRQAWTRLSHPHRPSHENPSKRARRVVLSISAATAAAGLVFVSYKTRQWREEHISQLPSWQTLLESHKRRNIQDLTVNMTRAKLMGTRKTGVSQELNDIRQWHIQHGYKGGLVLRELNKPIFTGYYDIIDDTDDNDEDQSYPDFEFLDAMALARRECYYLYYELMGNGEIRQEIFCRGTTLGVDILTCLQFWWQYDDDLDCHVHKGFANHANHLLQDVLPLLAPPTDKRATIEISGHSLGGAVAFLLAMKLKLRGYNVVKVTTVGAPRFCYASSVEHLSKLLPPDTLRIEDDLDIVPFLPPFARHLGDKLWIVDNDSRYVPFPQYPWTESVWINFRFYEILTSFTKHHRVGSYIAQLLKATNGHEEVEQLSSMDDLKDDSEEV